MTHVLVDAHVHFHPGFDRESFLDAAWENLLRWARGLGAGREQTQAGGADSSPLAAALFTGVLLLADPPGWDSFDALTGGKGAGGRWTVDEPRGGAISARRADGASLTLLEGRQVASVEKLEVLALAWNGELPARASFHELVKHAVDRGAITILPWGFGKWLAARGEKVASEIEGAVPGRVFVGDSGARMAGTPVPALLRRAAERHVYNLPGSDPFPLSSHERRAGSRGFVLTGELSPEDPAESFRALLGALAEQPPTFGGGMGPLRFLSSQLRLRIGSHGAGRAA
jgi:hypothetical protein